MNLNFADPLLKNEQAASLFFLNGITTILTN